MTRALQGLVAAVVFGAVLTASMVVGLLPGSSGWALLVFPALAVIAEVKGADVYGSSTVSLSAVPVLAAAAAGEARAALLGAALAGLTTTLRSGTHRVEQHLFNPAALVLCAGVAVLVTAPVVDRPLALLVAGGVLAGLAYFAVDNGLVALAIGLDQGRSPRTVLREDLSWLLPSFAAYGLLGTLLGSAWTTAHGWGVIAFLVPPALLRQAQKQYLQRTEESVRELRRSATELHAAHDALSHHHRSTAAALAQAIEARDSGTGGHVQRVTALAQALLQVVDPALAADEHLSFGFLLHDVGKIGVPDAILRKPGPLTPVERQIMDTHPEIGHRIVAQAGFSPLVSEIVLTHHERWDGGGYPRGLRGEEIPLATRLFAVADSLDAMTSDRPYRHGVPLEVAVAEVVRHSGTQFDPAAVAALLELDRGLVAQLLQVDRQRIARPVETPTIPDQSTASLV
ncbi:MAG TPA: HD-GYP domain-containing protein [Mycobacteriales bacterium]|nr:HD-GYP domain-containing protein [Mycobacteriales bacterium]